MALGERQDSLVTAMCCYSCLYSWHRKPLELGAVRYEALDFSHTGPGHSYHFAVQPLDALWFLAAKVALSLPGAQDSALPGNMEPFLGAFMRF